MTVRVFRGRLSNFVCVLLSRFCIEGRMWNVIVLIPDHCLSVYFLLICDRAAKLLVVFTLAVICVCK